MDTPRLQRAFKHNNNNIYFLSLAIRPCLYSQLASVIRKIIKYEILVGTGWASRARWTKLIQEEGGPACGDRFQPRGTTPGKKTARAFDRHGT